MKARTFEEMKAYVDGYNACFEAMKSPNGTYEEMVAWHLGTIDSFLADISKSLAVIADAMSGKEKGG